MIKYVSKVFVLCLGIMVLESCLCDESTIMISDIGNVSAFVIDVENLTITETNKIDTFFSIRYDLDFETLESGSGDCETNVSNPLDESKTKLTLDKMIIHNGDSIMAGDNLVELDHLIIGHGIHDVQFSFFEEFVDSLDIEKGEYEFMLELVTLNNETFTSSIVLELDL